MNNNKKGFIPVMLTPFKENGSIDFDGLTELIEFYLSAGASGLFANCLSSEMFDLTPEERLLITKHIIKASQGQVPVVATATFGGKIEKQADFVKEMYDTGLEAAIVITNMLAAQEETEEVFKKKVYDLFEHTGNIPLGFYECPEPYKRILSAKQLQEFVQTGRVIYHKDTSLNIDQVRMKVEATKANSAFGLYDAYMVHAAESLKAGSAGLSCIQGNYFPELIVWFCENYTNETMKSQVAEVQQFLIDNMDVMHQDYPMSAKYYLQKCGVKISILTRTQGTSLMKDLKDRIEILFQAYSKLKGKIGLTG